MPETASLWRDNERGQSEVIGSILVVAIVIVLAALIGQSIFGLDAVGDGEQPVMPQVNFETDVHDGNLTIGHRSGDRLDMEEVTVTRSGTGVIEQPETEWTSSHEAVIVDLEEGETVRVLWHSSRTESSKVLYEYQHD